MITPLQPREFFRGCWRGEGQLVPHPLLRPFQRRERILFCSEAQWLSDTFWLVRDRMEFSSGWIYERKMFAELIAPDRIHVTADDMPLGADILLHERGFRFTPYHAWGSFQGRIYRMRFHDECVLGEDGRIHDTIRMYYFGLPVATMLIGPIDRNVGEPLPMPPPGVSGGSW
jgi:hypothetical protein